MNYTVEWTAAAINQLTTLWMNASDRSAVTTAADAIDAALERDPLVVGESRPGGRRILIELPLAVYYRVNLQTRRVIVSTVWHC